MKKISKMIVVFLVFLLIVITLGFFIKSQQQSEKPSENPSDNRWLFPDCPGITAKFLDLHPDFKTNRSLLKGWVKPHFLSYGGIEDWLKNGFRSDDSDFVRWILSVKAESITDFSIKVKYWNPHLLNEVADISELRKEYEKWKENNN